MKSRLIVLDGTQSVVNTTKANLERQNEGQLWHYVRLDGVLYGRVLLTVTNARGFYFIFYFLGQSMENFKTQFVTLNVFKASFFVVDLFGQNGKAIFRLWHERIFRSKHEGHIWVKAWTPFFFNPFAGQKDVCLLMWYLPRIVTREG